MSRANLRKNRKNLLIPNVALSNVNHADPVHRLPCELPTIIRVPRHEDDEPIAINLQNLDGVKFGMNPVGVGGGVGGGVEEDFKMHLVFSKNV